MCRLAYELNCLGIEVYFVKRGVGEMVGGRGEGREGREGREVR